MVIGAGFGNGTRPSYNERDMIYEPCKLILVGNKIDIEQRKVTEQEAKEFATKNEMKYY